MDCIHYVEEIELIDGLIETEKQKLSTHLTDCTTCQQYYYFSLKIEPILLDAMRNVTLPPIREKILSKLPKANSKSTHRRLGSVDIWA